MPLAKATGTSDFYCLVVEDDPLVADDLTLCIQDLGYQVIGPANDFATARQLLEERLPDLVFLDIDLGGEETGIDVATLINREYKIPFIFLTAFSDQQTLQEVKAQFPAGFVLKPFDENRLRAAIQIAFHNYYSIIRFHLTGLDRLNKALVEPLTRRETELLQLLCSGKSNQELANALFVSINTVKTHLKNLYLKLDVGNRAEAIIRVQHWMKDRDM